jgi:large subunit ribosomal protein L35|tara:strand:- start:8443 stop:8640 length:198 start_codon:yes stop_codon:yes gene_type:complete
MKLKLKTRKSAAKRIKIKKNCLRRKKAYKGHLLRRKNSKQLRTLSAPANIHTSDIGLFAAMIPYR